VSLPNLRPEVQAFVRHRQQKPVRSTSVQPSGGCIQGLSSERERHAWSVLCARHGPGVNADISQSLGRIPLCADGTSPTVTPNGRVVIAHLKRVLVPLEKLMVHGLLVHRMCRPSGMSGQQLAKLRGNTMDVRCVGVAMLLGMSMVKPCLDRPGLVKNLFVCAPRPCHAPGVPTSQKTKTNVAVKKSAGRDRRVARKRTLTRQCRNQ